MKKLQYFKIANLKNFLIISFLIFMILFSLNQIKNEVSTIFFLWKSHGEKIVQGNLDKTYAGFENFDYFLWWCDEKIPADKNVAILYPRETQYIYPRTAYVLYPRNVITIKTEEKSLDEIYEEITDNSVNYLIVLKPLENLKNLESNFKNLKLIDRYKDKTGFIYKVEYIVKD